MANIEIHSYTNSVLGSLIKNAREQNLPGAMVDVVCIAPIARHYNLETVFDPEEDKLLIEAIRGFTAANRSIRRHFERITKLCQNLIPVLTGRDTSYFMLYGPQEIRVYLSNCQLRFVDNHRLEEKVAFIAHMNKHSANL